MWREIAAEHQTCIILFPCSEFASVAEEKANATPLLSKKLCAAFRTMESGSIYNFHNGLSQKTDAEGLAQFRLRHVQRFPCMLEFFSKNYIRSLPSLLQHLLYCLYRRQELKQRRVIWICGLSTLLGLIPVRAQTSFLLHCLRHSYYATANICDLKWVKR